MKTQTVSLIALIFFTITVSMAQDQMNVSDSTRRFQVETKDGNFYVGKILELNADQIVLETKTLGLITLKQINVKRVTEVNAATIKNGEHWFENPQAARYFWAPNGYGLKKGEGYYQNVWVLANQVSVGLSDHISMGVGLVPTFLFNVGATPFWITPKVSIPVKRDKVNLGAGVLYANAVGENASGNSGVALTYGIATLGNRDKNMSIGIGYGWSNGSWSNRPAIMMSFMSRVSRNGYFISENYLISTQDATLGLLSLGGRKIIRRVGLDFGGFIPFGSEVQAFVVIPWLGITVPLGKKQN